MPYPVPSYAANIWVVGDTLWLGFPGTEDGVRPHSVAFPTTLRGMEAMIAVLKNRGEEKKTRQIGAKGAPTGVEIEKALSSDKSYNEWLRKQGAKKAEKQREAMELDELLTEIGL